MEALSEKIFLKLDMPNDQNRRGDRDKIFDVLKEKYGEVIIPYKILKELYPKIMTGLLQRLNVVTQHKIIMVCV